MFTPFTGGAAPRPAPALTIRWFTLLPGLLLLLIGPVRQEAHADPSPCPPDTLFVDFTDIAPGGPFSVAVTAPSGSGGISLSNSDQRWVGYSFDHQARTASITLHSIGGNTTGGRALSRERFELTGTSAGASGTAMIVARVELSLQATTHFWRGTTVAPSGTCAARLMTPSGVVTWGRPVSTVGSDAAVLESLPFQVPVGAPFAVSWECEAHSVLGAISLNGRLALGTWGDPAVEIQGCDTALVALTPVRATTWSNLKSFYRETVPSGGLPAPRRLSRGRFPGP